MQDTKCFDHNGTFNVEHIGNNNEKLKLHNNVKFIRKVDTFSVRLHRSQKCHL